MAFVRLVKYIFLGFFLLAPALAQAATIPTAAKDFFITKAWPELERQDRAVRSLVYEEQDCRANIKQVVCLVDPATAAQQPDKRKCLENSADYAIYFEQLYDNYPPVLQKMFCSLHYLFIESDFDGTAYASPIQGADGHIHGAIMGVRKSVLDQNLNLFTWATWKEQLSFGGPAQGYSSLPNLPAIQSATNAKVNDLLYFVVTHEFGHFFDFANNLNKLINCQGDPFNGGHCDLDPSGWNGFSWKDLTTALSVADFPLREKLCFYSCNGNTISAGEVNNLYQNLWNSNFISAYAATNLFDDFADSLAYFLSNKNLGTSYQIDTKQGFLYNSMEKLGSPQFAKKREYMEKFIQRTDILYP